MLMPIKNISKNYIVKKNESGAKEYHIGYIVTIVYDVKDMNLPNWKEFASHQSDYIESFLPYYNIEGNYLYDPYESYTNVIYATNGTEISNRYKELDRNGGDYITIKNNDEMTNYKAYYTLDKALSSIPVSYASHDAIDHSDLENDIIDIEYVAEQAFEECDNEIYNVSYTRENGFIVKLNVEATFGDLMSTSSISSAIENIFENKDIKSISLDFGSEKYDIINDETSVKDQIENMLTILFGVDDIIEISNSSLFETILGFEPRMKFNFDDSIKCYGINSFKVHFVDEDDEQYSDITDDSFIETNILPIAAPSQYYVKSVRISFYDEDETNPNETNISTMSDFVLNTDNIYVASNGTEYNDSMPSDLKIPLNLYGGSINTRIEIIGSSATYPADLKDNQIIVSPNDKGKFQVGGYLLSEVTTDFDEFGNEIIKGSRITRIIKTQANKDRFNKVQSITVTCQSIIKVEQQGEQLFVEAYKSVDSWFDYYNMFALPGFQLTNKHLPDGTSEKQHMILESNLNEDTNMFKALIDRDYISFRYLVDSFGLGIEPECKSIYSRICQARKSAFALVNCPSSKDFRNSADPSFIDKKGSVKPEYIADGGNLDKDPIFTFSLPTELNGASWGAWFYPFVKVRDIGGSVIVPPAAYVSNNFMEKYAAGNAWDICAGQRRGVISGVIGTEVNITKNDRDYFETIGINSIVWTAGVGPVIYANKTAKQNPMSGLSAIHIRECCIYIQDAVEKILGNYIFEKNNAQTRLEIKTLVDNLLENIKNNGGIYDYATICDTSNNTAEIIDRNIGIIDIYIEPQRGLEKVVQRLTILRTGAISANAFA